MSKRKRVTVLSSSDDEDEEIQPPRPKKKPPARLPSQGENGGFIHDPSSNAPGIQPDYGPYRESRVISDDEEDMDIISESSDERRPMCNISGCFLEEITLPTSIYMTNFQGTKHELAKRLYQLYNTTIFEDKLPHDMSIIWNKRITRLAGSCLLEMTNGVPSCTINLSEKVIDSADRLRDALVHEMCHAACFLICKQFDKSHGPKWWAIAKHVTVIHPELPKLEAYANYNINYPFNYECCFCERSVRRFRMLRGPVFCRFCKKLFMTTGRNSPSSPIN